MIKINTDFKKCIFTYLRKKPKKYCIECGRVCIWDKKKVFEFISYPIQDNSIWISVCKFCY